MGFKTPRGRQIDLSTTEGFLLMGSIWKVNHNYDAYSILRMCEAIDNLPQLLSFLFGFIAVSFYNDQPWSIPVALTAGSLIGSVFLMGSTLVGLNIGFPLLLPILKVWNRVPEILRLIVPPVIIAITSYWLNSIMWLIGLVSASIASLIIMSIAGRATYRTTGLLLAQAERCFLLACHLYSIKAKLDFKSLMLQLASANDDVVPLAEECLSDYAKKYPQYVMRATE